MPLCPALGRSLASSPPPTGRSWLEFMMDETELGTQNKRINARASRELYFANKPAGILHYLLLIFYISLHSRTSISYTLRIHEPIAQSRSTAPHSPIL